MRVSAFLALQDPTLSLQTRPWTFIFMAIIFTVNIFFTANGKFFGRSTANGKPIETLLKIRWASCKGLLSRKEIYVS